MPVSKFLLTISVLAIGVLAACSGPGTYPVTGMNASASDPVMSMDVPGMDMGVEAR